ncbi:MAG TPA: alpha/beta hydrolase-fold protein [Bryobacteraceae bacterium]|jgi:S-formylglutathione hydrolase|nr:alpha/beta hydrolase-fold protein [Bryobacteraceae bacterium]
MRSTITLSEIPSQHLPAPVPYAVLAPEGQKPLPLCVLLLGAGGTRDSMTDLQPLFDAWWAENGIPPMIIATPTSGLDYYMEDHAGTIRWDSFLGDDFIPHLRSTCGASDLTVISGISGGGYGALKLAFARPHSFAGVAAMQPMLEPGLCEAKVGARNRLHHSAGGPPQLIGPARDPSFWESNNPANRARDNAQQIRDSRIAIYLEAGDYDFLNAHDGTEFLHRLLWDLDLSHEYHLVRNADHGGPTMRPRLYAMFAWIGSLWNPLRSDAAAEEAAMVWLNSGMEGKPPAGATTTSAFIHFLRARFEPLRAQAAQNDPTTKRRFGVW